MNGEFDGYIVKCRDVDGSSSSRYKSLAGAVKRFEEMCRKVDFAIAESYYKREEAGKPMPKIEELVYLRGVGDYGNVVEFIAKGAKEEAARAAWNAAREAENKPASAAPIKSVSAEAYDIYADDIPF